MFVHARERRAAPAPLDEALDRVRIALGEGFDAAVAAIAHPAANADLERRLHGGVAKSHALHAPVHHDETRDLRHDPIVPRWRSHANSAAIDLPSVRPPQS